jgi:shikimate dehydrogenase
MTRFGLIGFPLSHSFSSAYFAEKFLLEGLKDYRYDLFPMQKISELPALIKANPDLRGLNVTIPHKVEVIQILHDIDAISEGVGAVNTIEILRSGNKVNLKGYNTDVIGFETSLVPLLKPWHKQALVLGTGGASKAVGYVLHKIGIPAIFVSRKPNAGSHISYDQLNKEVMEDHHLVIQTTPLGKYPDIEKFPPIPFEYLTENHLLYDLNYNPEITRFMQLGTEHGATVKNGLQMLHLQADASWNIWKQHLTER